MGECDLAVSTLFATVDRLFAAASDAAILAERPYEHHDALVALAARLDALQAHAGARLAALGGAPPDDGDELAAAAATGEEACPALVEVSEGVAVPAVLLPPGCATVDAIRAAITTPELHYVPGWRQFAVRIGQHVIRGGLGRIYPPGVNWPVCVRECRPALCRGPACTYYHDPKTAAGGGAPAGARNFTAAGFMYVPAAAPVHRQYGGRRVGDRDSLLNDLRCLTAADARLFVAQVAHDVVCAAAVLHNRPDLFSSGGASA